MGPSGAGKDTLLALARRRLAGSAIAFAHRYITRDPVPDDENFIALDEAEFAAREAAGLFAYAWAAHGVRYAIGAEIGLWRQRGFAVVVSGSRAHFATMRDDRALVPVLITAPADCIASRLAARGREDAAAIAERLARGGAYTIDHPRLITIMNDGPVERAGEALVAALRALAPAGGVRPA